MSFWSIMNPSWLTALVLCACVMLDISEASHHYKKSVIIHNLHAKKKFDIMAKPQVTPNAMTVVMKGTDGSTGKQGLQGDQGKPGPPGPKGLPGDQGPKGVCPKTQCENGQLKLVIQRLLALEKYVNSKFKPGPPSPTPSPNPCKKPTTGKPGSAQCAPAAAIIAIVPLTQSLFKQGGPQGKGQGPGPGQVPGKGPTKPNQVGVGGPGQAKPSQAGPQGQGQGKPVVTSSPSGTGGAPTAPGVPSIPGAPGPRVQPPRPTASSVVGTPPAKLPVPPTGQPFITLKGVTSYDLPMPPIGIPPQQMTVVGGPLNQVTAVPANWVSSGTGPIDLKPALYRRGPISRADKENFYSRGWNVAKKHNIPSPGHGLLTHKLASNMLSKSHDKKSKIFKTKTIDKHARNHSIAKHPYHNKVKAKQQHVKTRNAAIKKPLIKKSSRTED